MVLHYQNPYLPHAQRTAAAPPAPRKLAQVTLDPNGLPVGTAAQVMDWVDDDPDRALAFLAKEQSETRPRVSLVASLKAVLKRHEIVPEEPAPQTDSAPDEGDSLSADPVDQLALVRDRLQVGNS